MKNLRKILAASLLFLASAAVSALPVDIIGIITFGGTVTGNTADIKDATSLTFGGTLVTSATGDYAADGVGFGDLATFASPLAVTGTGPVSVMPLWTVTGTSFTWSFDLMNITSIDRTTAGFLGITGTGFGKSNDPLSHNATDGFWTLSADQNTGSGTIAFSSTTAVPEPASLALLGIGILGMAAVRRRKGVSA